tara:strand:- start:133 stop:867 length:735 start_codon:yes stop_codon:yes gene_type:complete
MKLSFIIPCLNSSKIIKNSIRKLIEKLNKKKILYELIVVDDGSVDNTLSVLKKIKKKNIKIISNFKNLGKSSSIIKGIRKAKYEKIVLIDDDIPYFNYLDKVINLLKKNNFVYINRRSKKSKLLSKNLTFYQLCRHFISNFVSIIINTILLDKNIGDTQAGLKGFKKPKNFNRYQFISKKFFLDAELMILFHRSKMQLKSVALKYKMYNESTIKVFALQNFQYLFELLRVIIYYKIVKTNKIIL